MSLLHPIISSLITTALQRAEAESLIIKNPELNNMPAFQERKNPFLQLAIVESERLHPWRRCSTKKAGRKLSHQIFDFAKTLVKPSLKTGPQVFWWCLQVVHGFSLSFHGIFTPSSHFKMDQTNQNNGLEKDNLVGGFNPSEKYQSVGMIIPNI